jgi:hypothetical protein
VVFIQLCRRGVDPRKGLQRCDTEGIGPELLCVGTYVDENGAAEDERAMKRLKSENCYLPT